MLERQNEREGGVLARSQAMRSALDLCRLYARFNRPVVFKGPVGAGKTTLARELHRSSRLPGKFVPVSSGHLGETLYGDTLFGHVEGAFTGASRRHEGVLAEASQGVLLLDDLALMPMAAQAALLRVMERGQYRPLGAAKDQLATCRINFATTVEPRELVAAGRLLPDLESRLGELVVPVPPLSARKEDIMPIALRVAGAMMKEHGMHAQLRLGEGVERLLCAYDWPQNVRELRAVVERAVVHAGMCDGVVEVRPAHLPRRVREHSPTSETESASLTRETVEAAVRAAGGNQSEAARRLGIHRNTVARHLRAG